MSKGRLVDLREALILSGWEILNEQGDKRYQPELYNPTGEVLVWGLLNNKTGSLLNLEFHIFGELGQLSLDLKDILYCLLPERESKLYFYKRETDEWKLGVEEFIKSINKDESVDNT